MRYSTDLKQEIRNYWMQYGKVATYRKYPHIYSERIRKWCDKEYYEREKQKDSLKFKKWYSSLSTNEKGNLAKRVGEWGRKYNKVSAIVDKQMLEYYNQHEQNLEKTAIQFNLDKDKVKSRLHNYQKSLEYQEQNKQQIYAGTRQWFQKNKEHVKQYNVQHRIKNKDYIRAKYRERKRTDPVFKLIEEARSFVYIALKRFKTKKSIKTINLIGCDIQAYKQYLEERFLPGMTWQNYGKQGWEIDHIRPIASFNLVDIEEQKKCFHYTNTQPMWRQENQSKTSRFQGKLHTIKETIAQQTNNG